MIWCITWAAAASHVAVIEFAVACRYMYKYKEMLKSCAAYRCWFHCDCDKRNNNDG